MNIRNITTSIFDLDYQNKFYLVAFLSSDYNNINPKIDEYPEVLNKVIEKRIGTSLKDIFRTDFSTYNTWDMVPIEERGTCVINYRVLGLIVRRFRNNPTAKYALINALRVMRKICEARKITDIAMLKNDPGLKNIKYDTLVELLREAFDGYNINVVFCDSYNIAE